MQPRRSASLSTAPLRTRTFAPTFPLAQCRPAEIWVSHYTGVLAEERRFGAVALRLLESVSFAGLIRGGGPWNYRAGSNANRAAVQATDGRRRYGRPVQAP